jgi:hypothetical protein
MRPRPRMGQFSALMVLRMHSECLKDHPEIPCDPLALLAKVRHVSQDVEQIVTGKSCATWHPLIPTCAHSDGVATVRTATGYHVLRAAKRQAFELHNVRKRRTLEEPISRIHKH